jgi:hypothetical protein
VPCFDQAITVPQGNSTTIVFGPITDDAGNAQIPRPAHACCGADTSLGRVTRSVSEPSLARYRLVLVEQHQVLIVVGLLPEQ